MISSRQGVASAGRSSKRQESVSRPADGVRGFWGQMDQSNKKKNGLIASSEFYDKKKLRHNKPKVQIMPRSSHNDMRIESDSATPLEKIKSLIKRVNKRKTQAKTKQKKQSSNGRNVDDYYDNEYQDNGEGKQNIAGAESYETRNKQRFQRKE